jgi:hypothetical protein
VKNPIVCGLLVLATGGGVAFVVANRPTPVPLPDATTRLTDTAPADPSVPCPQCQTGACVVTDVTDLSARFAAKSEVRGEFISFDEPPLAKPKPDVTAVGHEVPEMREVLPPPREVK